MPQALLDFTAKPSRRMADTSLFAWRDRILPTLTDRETAVFLALCAFIEATGQSDVTGGELTEYMKRHGLAKDVNDCRPRLHGLQKKGWIESGIARSCRAYMNPAHPYWPVVPKDAIERMQYEKSRRKTSA